jgi:hypothetical protein
MFLKILHYRSIDAVRRAVRLGAQPEFEVAADVLLLLSAHRAPFV